jgi:hypothetical protein
MAITTVFSPTGGLDEFLVRPLTPAGSNLFADILFRDEAIGLFILVQL